MDTKQEFKKFKKEHTLKDMQEEKNQQDYINKDTAVNLEKEILLKEEKISDMLYQGEANIRFCNMLSEMLKEEEKKIFWFARPKYKVILKIYRKAIKDWRELNINLKMDIDKKVK